MPFDEDLRYFQNCANNHWIDPRTNKLFNKLYYYPYTQTLDPKIGDYTLKQAKCVTYQVPQSVPGTVNILTMAKRTENVNMNYLCSFPWNAGSADHQYAGVVVIPKRRKFVVTTAALSGCSIRIYDTIHPDYRVYIHDGNLGIQQFSKRSIVDNTRYVINTIIQTVDNTFICPNLLNIPCTIITPANYAINSPQNPFHRLPWIFNCDNGDIHAFFFTQDNNRHYIPEYNVYLIIHNNLIYRIT